MRKLPEPAVIKEWDEDIFVITSDNLKHESERLFIDINGFTTSEYVILKHNADNSLEGLKESWKKYVANVKKYDKVVKRRSIVLETLTVYHEEVDS